MKTKTIPEEIAELRAMAVPELVARYEAVFEKAPRVKHRSWLWRRIAWKIQEQRLGGLSTVAKAKLEEVYFHLLNHLHRETGTDALCVAGGVTLNSVANGKAFTHTPFRRFAAHPARLGFGQLLLELSVLCQQLGEGAQQAATVEVGIVGHQLVGQGHGLVTAHVAQQHEALPKVTEAPGLGQGR